MGKFSSQFLSYYKKLPRGATSIFLPVWIWKVFAPVINSKKEFNFFQQIILEFLQIGKQDRQAIADWMGVDIELVSLIIDTELEPNGWIKNEENALYLTDKALRLLDDEIEQQTDLKAYYLIQDAMTGKLWHRLIPNKLNILDIVERDGKIQISGSRDSGKPITPFLIEPKYTSEPRVPSHNQILQTIKHHNWAVRGQLVRDIDEKIQYLDQQNLKNYEFYDQSPESFYILSHIIDDNHNGSHICQLQDPCHISQFDDWIQNLHFEIATSHKPFSNKIKSFLGDNFEENETIEAFEDRLLQEISFELTIDFPYAYKIGNLEKHLSRLLARRTQLDNQNNDRDIDDLLTQCQKALESCFKHMLKVWSHPHPRMIVPPKHSNRNTLNEALNLRIGNLFEAKLLKSYANARYANVFSANGFSAGIFSDPKASLKPLIVSNLLIIPEYESHPLTLRKSYTQDLEFLLQICELRNDATHDSPDAVDISISTALILAERTLNWISFFTAIEA